MFWQGPICLIILCDLHANHAMRFNTKLIHHSIISKNKNSGLLKPSLLPPLLPQQPVLSNHGLLTTVAYQLGPKEPVHYALEVGVVLGKGTVT